MMHDHHLRETAQQMIETDQTRDLMAGMAARVAEHDGFCVVSAKRTILLLRSRGHNVEQGWSPE